MCCFDRGLAALSAVSRACLGAAVRGRFRHDVTRKTRRFARARVAEYEIGPALDVVAPAAADAANVLVFDDVYTAA